MNLSRRRLLTGASAIVAVAYLFRPRNAYALTISNVHTGLTAWASSTFVLGQRCSTGGNAYQCTTAGSSTAAPTGTGSSINNGGVAVFKWLSAIDFTTIQAWWNALPATWTTNVQANIWNDGVILCTTTVSWLDTSASLKNNGGFTALITCAPGESIRDFFNANPTAPKALSQTNGVCFIAPATGTGVSIDYLFINTPQNITLDGLQFIDPNSSIAGNNMIGIGGLQIFRDCIIDGYGDGAGPGNAMIASTDVNSKMINCLIVDRKVVSGPGSTYFSSGDGMLFYNCTFVSINANTGGHCINAFFAAQNNVKAENCIFMGFSAPFLVNANTVPVTNCLFSNASLPTGASGGTGDVYSATAAATFVAATTNFQLKVGSGALNTGLSDPTNVSPSDDLAKVARPQGSGWDIGAFEMIPVNARSQIRIIE